MRHDVVLNRIRAEYLEMPGLTLTAAQLQRLCGIEPAACQRVLTALMDECFLFVNANGRYMRLTDGAVAHPRPAMAQVHPNAFPLSSVMRS